MALRVTHIAPGVHRLATRYENWYLLESGGRLTVLDAGLPGHWQAFCSALDSLGHTMTDIDAVLITHHHPDHFGTAERIRTSGAKVYAHPADAPFLRRERRVNSLKTLPYLRHRRYRRYMVHLLANRVTAAPAVAQLNDMADGEILDVPGRPRVVHAPGHTAGHCAVLLEDKSLLFTGDALVTLDITKGRTGPQIVRGPVTEDADLAVESLKVLSATHARTVLPGHGEPWLEGIESAVALAGRT